MKLIPRTTLAIALIVGAACADSPTEPINTSLVGVWTLVGYEEGGRVASPSGTWVFFDDGFMALDLQLDFPTGPSGPLAATGNFQQVANGVVMEVRSSETAWGIEFTATHATFRQTSPQPANGKMILRRF